MSELKRKMWLVYVTLVMRIYPVYSQFIPEYVPVAIWSRSKLFTQTPVFDLVSENVFEKIMRQLTSDNQSVLVFRDKFYQTNESTHQLNKLQIGDAETRVLPSVLLPFTANPQLVLNRMYAYQPNHVFSCLDIRSGRQTLPNLERGTMYVFNLNEEIGLSRFKHFEHNIKTVQELIDRMKVQFRDTTIVYFRCDYQCWFKIDRRSHTRVHRFDLPNDLGSTIIPSGRSDGLSQAEIEAEEARFEIGFKQNNVLFFLGDHFTITPQENLVREPRQSSILTNGNSMGAQDLQYLLYLGQKVKVENTAGSNTLEAGSIKVLTKLDGDAMNFTLQIDSESLVFHIVNKLGYFVVESVTSNSKKILIEDLYAPNNWSIYCPEYVINTESKRFIFREFQIQVSFEPGGKIQEFGEPYYCVGFTTVPILMGFFLVFICTIFLIFGVNALLDVRINTRTDGASLPPLPQGLEM